ncbi:uncharacterized protein LOC141850409 [Brevipalpus obovatus]|uniref:uncharacterized protein LOC141850409 n=1 Tax=Brevipalpus obovatus TaxID=246614 RepID=UPI003D9F52CD
MNPPPSNPSSFLQSSSSVLFLKFENDSRVSLHPEAIVLINSSLHDDKLTQSLGVYGSYVGIIMSLIAILIIIWSCYHCFCHGKDREKSSKMPDGDSTPSSIHQVRPYSFISHIKLDDQTAPSSNHCVPNQQQSHHQYHENPIVKCQKNDLPFSGSAIKMVSPIHTFHGSVPFSYTKPQEDFFAVYRNGRNRSSGIIMEDVSPKLDHHQKSQLNESGVTIISMTR